MTLDQQHKARIKKYFSAITRYNNSYVRESVVNKLRNAGRISPISLGYQRKYEKDISRLVNRVTAREWRTAAEEYGGDINGLAAFRKFKAASYDVSIRVSEIRNQLDSQIDLAMRVSEGKGLSESELVNETRRLLRNPDRLQMIARQQLGNRRKLKYDKGDYKKSEQNIQRLISNEATDYYRASFLQQILQDPKVKGFEIFLSPEHKITDICDILAGEYPKDFYYTKWHTGCKCGIRVITTGKMIKDVPRNFKAWLSGNEERILNAKNLPEWISENKKYVAGSANILDFEISSMMNKARQSAGDVSNMLVAMNKLFGGYSTPVNLKGRESMLRKVNTELNGDVSQVKDAVRATVVLPIKNYEELADNLEKIRTFERIKYQSPDKFAGYSGIITNFKTKNGIYAEVQFNTDKLIFAKEKPADAIRIMGEQRWNEIKNEIALEGGLGHEFYERMRILDRNDPQQNKEWLKLNEESRNYYINFR